jgi:hypothetical protein
MWQEEVVSIGKIQSLLDSGYEVEIDSPDGWVGVNFFIEKGEWQEYRLLTDNGFEVRCNEDHLFKTAVGWLSAKEIVAVQDRNQQVHFATKNGLSKGLIEQTGKIVDIVDINVNHENHRYYTNNVESHNTGVGKSLFMCHVAASCLTQNYNVLYITLEMSEEKIAERIDANLLNVTLDDLMNMPKDMYERRMQKLQEKVKGKLIIKEYPTASANPAHFRALINDLALKKNFRPDIIFIDYLNICASARIKAGANVNSYTYIKAIAEELRGLAVENNVPIVSATQTTRSGFCLSLDSKLIVDGTEKNICDVRVGDRVLSNTGYNTVTTIFPVTRKRMFKIRTASGKEIICSEEHVFPTKNGENSIKNGMKCGDFLLIQD